MMGLDNPIHLAFILILLLLVFGAKRLPEMGKSLGTGLRGFKESLSGEEHVAELSPLTHEQSPVTTPATATATATVEREHVPAQPVA